HAERATAVYPPLRSWKDSAPAATLARPHPEGRRPAITAFGPVMPSRRPSRGRGLVVTALIALAFAMAPPATFAHGPISAGSGGFHPRLAHRAAGISGHLH